MQHLRAAAVAAGAVAAALAGLTGCGSSTSSTSTPGLVTNPPAVGTPAPPVGTASASPGASQQPASGTRTVLAPLGLNLRTQPDRASSSLGDLAQGTVVTVLAHVGQNGGWFQVKGETQTGWISDDPNFSSPRRFNLYQSDQRGFGALYPDSWTFTEQPPEVIFRPQTGGASITVVIAASLDAIGPPGRTGYSLSSTESSEVDGITGLLRTYDRTGSAPAPSPGEPEHLDHLAEFRATIDAKRAIRADLDYTSADIVPIFRDVLNSIIFPAPATPAASPGGAAAPPTP
jgi:hypothetical protein